ncbi:MAG: hypothetical protein ACOX7J_08255 [Bacillota bacterium]|jgi:pyruvate-formate lyase-activating enzyme
MLQIDFLCELLKKGKENGIHTAVDTAGHIPFERFEKIIPYTDLFLYDIKSMDSQVHKKFTGAGNELILENLAKLLKMNIPVWIRVPIIPGVNDSIEEMRRIKEFLNKYGSPQKIELLPYHRLGEHKYDALGMKLQEFSVPGSVKMKELKSVIVDSEKN